jgi:uncharacterized integral membrane protein
MVFIIGIILGGGLVVFALQNLTPVMVSFLGWNFEGSVALIVLIAFLGGVIISLLFSLSSAIGGMMNEARLKKHNAHLQKELEDHKVMLAEAHQQIIEKPVDTVIIQEVRDDTRL